MQDKQRRSGKSAAGGFTLVELMVVISIIAILATIVGYNVLTSVDDSNVAAAQAQIKNFKTALIAYKLKYKRFPDSLDALINNPKGIKFLDAPQVPSDPWGNQYQYQLDGNNFLITSYGADGSPGGTGYNADITSADLSGGNV